MAKKKAKKTAIRKVVKKAKRELGVVTHWYDRIGVAVVKLNGKLVKGATIRVKKGDEEFEDRVVSIQIDHKDVSSAKKGDDAGIKLSKPAKEGSVIFLVE